MESRKTELRNGESIEVVVIHVGYSAESADKEFDIVLSFPRRLLGDTADERYSCRRELAKKIGEALQSDYAIFDEERQEQIADAEIEGKRMEALDDLERTTKPIDNLLGKITGE